MLQFAGDQPGRYFQQLLFQVGMAKCFGTDQKWRMRRRGTGVEHGVRVAYVESE